MLKYRKQNEMLSDVAAALSACRETHKTVTLHRRYPCGSLIHFVCQCTHDSKIHGRIEFIVCEPRECGTFSVLLKELQQICERVTVCSVVNFALVEALRRRGYATGYANGCAPHMVWTVPPLTAT
mgnify:CR=1|jgi:hypothetical protein